MTLLWKPLLSGTLPIDPATGEFAWHLIPFPVYASPKEDGYRSMVQRGMLVSRNGLPVLNRELQARYSRREYEGLDGELTAGPPNGVGVFHRTSKIVRKASADASSVRFNVIDLHWDSEGSSGLDLSARVKMMRNTWPKQVDGLCGIPQILIKNVEQLKCFEQKCLAQNYEGVMLRRADQGAYPQKPGKENRSTLREFYLVRMKRFEQAEAIIVAVHPLEHNLNTERTAGGKRSSKKVGMVVDRSRVGSATLRDCKTGVEFDTNIGAERLRQWKGWPSAIGRKVRYKYQLCGTVDRPRINSCCFDELEVK